MHFDFLAISNVYSYDFVSSFFLTELDEILIFIAQDSNDSYICIFI